MMDNCDNRETLALARRYYLHLKSGAQITAEDMGRIIEGMEESDTKIESLRAVLQKAVDDYGKPGGPWNVPREPGAWIAMAQDALERTKS